jgi:hypothetical protein
LISGKYNELILSRMTCLERAPCSKFRDKPVRLKDANTDEIFTWTPS